MKRNYPLLIFILVFIAVLSGNLTAGISLVGRFGVNFFYKEYQFFKVWWQAALVCFALLLIITIILFLIDKKSRMKTAKTIKLFFLLVCLAGLYFTFRDFRTTLSHRWLGERFHLGIYLYWIGLCIISLFFLTTKSGNRQLRKK